MALLLKFWPYFLVVAAAAFGLFRAWCKGVADEKAAQAKQDAYAHDISNQVQNDIGALPPDRVREELKTWDPKH